MWDITSNCWNVHVDHYYEALRLMDEYQRYHRYVNISKIPKLTWELKRKSIPFSFNNVITIEERGNGKQKGQ